MRTFGLSSGTDTKSFLISVHFCTSPAARGHVISSFYKSLILFQKERFEWEQHYNLVSAKKYFICKISFEYYTIWQEWKTNSSQSLTALAPTRGQTKGYILIISRRGKFPNCFASQWQYWFEMYLNLTLKLITSNGDKTSWLAVLTRFCTSAGHFPPFSTVTAKMDLLSPAIQPKQKEHKVINTNFILRLRLLGVMTFRLNGTRWKERKKKSFAVNVSQSNSTHMKKLRKKSVDIIPLMMLEHLQRKYI